MSTEITEADMATQRMRVHLFIEGRLNGKVKVRSYRRLVDYFRGAKDNEKYGLSSVVGLWESDAQNYLNHLVAVINKTSNPASEEVTEAVKELYECINVLAEDIIGSNYFMVGVNGPQVIDWIQTIRTVPDMIHDLTVKMDKRDTDITDILIEIKKWMDKYGRILDKINAEIIASKQRVREIGGQH